MQKFIGFQSPPTFLKGRIRQAMHFVLEAILQATTPDQTLRSWKLWLLLPRMLLHRPPGIRTISKPNWRLRITQFQEGEWTALLRNAAAANPPTADGSTGQRRTLPETPNLEQRTRRARQLVHQGELSAARQALTAGPLAPSTAATLQELRDPARRPPQPYQDFPQHLREFHPPAPPNIPPTQLLTNLRRARKGAAPGPSGFTAEVLRLVLDDDATTQHFVAVATSLAKAEVPHQVSQAIGLGRVVALQKPNGRVRGIVIGDLLRRLVSRSLAQTYASHFHTACMPHQFALSTRTGTEAIVHALTAATEANPQHTILSIDGIGAYDTISRTSMLEGLRRVPDANRCLPFVRQFYAQPSTYVWQDSNGRPHPITQAEGGEQGDPLMPALFSLGQRGALEAVQANLEEGETLFAFLDDVYAVSPPHSPGHLQPAGAPPRNPHQHPAQQWENQNLERSRTPAPAHHQSRTRSVGRQQSAPPARTRPHRPRSPRWNSGIQTTTSPTTPNRTQRPPSTTATTTGPPSIMVVAFVLRQPKVQLPTTHAPPQSHRPVCPRPRRSRRRVPGRNAWLQPTARHRPCHSTPATPLRRSRTHIGQHPRHASLLGLMGRCHASFGPASPPTSGDHPPPIPTR